MRTCRILVTGSRDWSDPEAVYGALNATLREAWLAGCTRVIVVHGGARGADRHAGEWTRFPHHYADVPVIEEVHPADWNRHGKAAGHIRNQEMVDLDAHVCLAFFLRSALNRGTQDCVRRAEKAGIPVRRYEA